ncbi:MAG: hypothetical protein H6624_18880 [Bdellovibrionaceae bacterium]|nr:hypothetical protein [Bdellovibrionales bacterium]MCB9086412.1 hypothetical protein [Pseudobdellovibrionaceae bacterium]
MEDGLQIDQSKSGDQLLLTFRGDINENADFSGVELSGAKEIVLDMAQIRLLNSVGLRSWLLWIKTFAGDRSLVFINCPRHVVDQMNILDGFLPLSARVESFFVPYFCEHCEKTDSVLAVRGKDYMEATANAKEGVTLPDEKTCPHCNQQMEMDVLKDRYFSFLKHKK